MDVVHGGRGAEVIIWGCRYLGWRDRGVTGPDFILPSRGVFLKVPLYNKSVTGISKSQPRTRTMAVVLTNTAGSSSMGTCTTTSGAETSRRRRADNHRDNPQIRCSAGAGIHEQNGNQVRQVSNRIIELDSANDVR